MWTAAKQIALNIFIYHIRWYKELKLHIYHEKMIVEKEIIFKTNLTVGFFFFLMSTASLETVYTDLISTVVFFSMCSKESESADEWVLEEDFNACEKKMFPSIYKENPLFLQRFSDFILSCLKTERFAEGN